MADGNTVAVGAGREDSLATGINGDGFDNSGNNSGVVFFYMHAPIPSMAQAP